MGQRKTVNLSMLFKHPVKFFANTRKGVFIRVLCIASTLTVTLVSIVSLTIGPPASPQLYGVIYGVLVPSYLISGVLLFFLKTKKLYWYFIITSTVSLICLHHIVRLDVNYGVYYLPLSTLLLFFGAAIVPAFPKPVIMTMLVIWLGINFIYFENASRSAELRIIWMVCNILALVSVEFALLFFVLFRNLSRAIAVQKDKIIELNELSALLNIALNESRFGLIGYNEMGQKYVERGAPSNRLFENQTGGKASQILADMQDFFEKVSAQPFEALFENFVEIQVNDYNYIIHAHNLNDSILITHMDVSELREVEARLRANQQLSLIGQITGGVAHNYNNSLAIALSSLEAIPNSGRNQGWYDYIAPAIHAIEQSTEISRKLLAMSGRQQLKLENFDISANIRDLTNLFRSVVGESTRLTIEATEPIWICTDKNEFETAVLNLIINARNAINAENGSISIATQIIDGNGVVKVKDNGFGIAPELHERVFEPFFSTSLTPESTGLGLSTVKGFVEQSNGRVELLSSTKGTTFLLHFPLSENENIVSLPTRFIANQAKSQARPLQRVLIVDDNSQVVRSLQMLLESRGYGALCETSPQRSIDLVQKHNDIGVAFIDYNMPEMNGVKLGKIIQDLRPDLPLYLLTGDVSAEAKAAIEGDDAPNFMGVYMKPLRASELFALLEASNKTSAKIHDFGLNA